MSTSEAPPSTLPDVWRGRSVTVMGLGQFGGGVAVVNDLLQRGAHVTLTDRKSEGELTAALASIPVDKLTALHLGGHIEEDFTSADVIVASPAVPPESNYLRLARQHGIPITTEIVLFWQRNRGRVIGITGSNGKSTTATLTAAMLTASGIPNHLGGNIGTSLLPIVDDITPEEWVVLELSSFQLHHLAGLYSGPEIGVITNCTPNHLDWHGEWETYLDAKRTLFRWQMPYQTAILNRDCPNVADWNCSGRRFVFGSGSPNCDNDLGLFLIENDAVWQTERDRITFPLRKWLPEASPHLIANTLAAMAAALSAGASREGIEQALTDFKPLPHRLQYVGDAEGCRIVDDSKSTTPAATIAALKATSGPVVLIAGGADKNIDLCELAEAIRQRTRAVALIGEVREWLADLVLCTGAEENSCGDCDTEPLPLVREFDSLAEAVNWTRSVAEPGETILLSPGCASLDMFTDFRDRGRQFQSLLCPSPTSS